MRVTASGQLRLPACCGALPVKSRTSAVAVDGRGAGAARGRRRRPPGRRGRARVAVRQRGQAGARAALGVVEHVVERAAQRRPARAAPASSPRRPRPTRFAASCARRSARRSPGWRICATSSSTARLVEDARRDHDALLVERLRSRPASSPACGPPTSAWWARLAANPSSVAAGERRGDHGDVRQVRAAGVRVVEDPGAPGACVARRARPRPRPASRPRCTGMCSACMTIRRRRRTARVEQSRRSLMFAECALRISTAPISSQAARSAPVDDLQRRSGPSRRSWRVLQDERCRWRRYVAAPARPGPRPSSRAGASTAGPRTTAPACPGPRARAAGPGPPAVARGP